MRALSLRARLTLWYTVALVIVLGLFSADILVEQKRLGVRRADAELDNVHATLANVFREELRELDAPDVAAREAKDAMRSLGDEIAIVDRNGRPLATHLVQLTLPEVMPQDRAPSVRTIEAASGQWRVQARPETISGDRFTLVIARPLTDLAREQRQLGEVILLVIPLALLLSGTGGWALASVGLRPVRQMARRAASIPLNGLEDLGTTPRDDELGQLARAFNGLVARLRGALETQRQFMADASHELRTPVSIIRTAADVTLSREQRDETEYRDALATTGAQARRLGRLVDDMLVLARADAGAYPLRPVTLYLDDVLEECRRAVELLATARGVTLRTQSPCDVAIRGDEELLRRLLLNLLQNAIQHSPSGGSVTVDIAPNGSRVYVRVADTGAGIADADRARIFERFVQLDPSRRAEGTGLGLPIAKWIAEVHDGSLSVESTGPAGSTFCIVLPISY